VAPLLLGCDSVYVIDLTFKANLGLDSLRIGWFALSLVAIVVVLNVQNQGRVRLLEEGLG